MTIEREQVDHKTTRLHPSMPVSPGSGVTSFSPLSHVIAIAIVVYFIPTLTLTRLWILEDHPFDVSLDQIHVVPRSDPQI